MWLWFVLGDPSLSIAARVAIEDTAHEKLVSPASYWEVAIKTRLGKYTLPQPHELFMQHAIDDQGFALHPVLPKHTALVATMPFHHRDPFDRLLTAQALVDDLTPVSADAVLDAYGVRRLW